MTDSPSLSDWWSLTSRPESLEQCVCCLSLPLGSLCCFGFACRQRDGNKPEFWLVLSKVTAPPNPRLHPGLSHGTTQHDRTQHDRTWQRCVLHQQHSQGEHYLISKTLLCFGDLSIKVTTGTYFSVLKARQHAWIKVPSSESLFILTGPLKKQKQNKPDKG